MTSRIRVLLVDDNDGYLQGVSNWLSGGAMLSVGSWVFMLAVFAGGYGMAYFVRRQWT